MIDRRVPGERTSTLTLPSDREIRTERELDAPRELVWRALTEPALLGRWWGRGNPLDIVTFEPVRGGHWRFVEHHGGGTDGFEGRFREVTPPERLVMTFEWDGMPGYPVINSMTLEALEGGRTRLVSVNLFLTPEDRDGMLETGMKSGLDQSYAALDAVLANERAGV